MKKFTIYSLLWIAVSLMVFTSCEQNNEEIEPLKLESAKLAYTGTPGVEENITNGGGTIELDASVTGLYHVRDFYQGEINPEPTDPHDRASTYYFRLTDNEGGNDTSFDLKFTGRATANIYPGSGSTLAYVDKSFSAVTASDYDANKEQAYFGNNSGSTIGWYNYNFLTHIVTAVSGRTFILKKGSDYYKIKFTSIYEGGAPDSPYAATDFPYFTFDYQKL
ncbi:hypothetical protein AAG747_11395 [Rapidithrix thailandica]|uniref:Uncharacterized protein n=1 Tax=Rapidithrix thailandica TaxID=413964 RepID=A0AAW9S7Y0_9BACT